PEEFLTKGLPRLAPGTTAVPLVAEVKTPAAKAVKAAIALTELRYRSYPSFTRVVVETAGALAFVVVPGRQEIRVRLPRLLVTSARTVEIADGLVREIRLEPTGADAVLPVTLEGTAGEVKASAPPAPVRAA